MFMDTWSHLVSSVLWITGLQPVEVSAFMENRGKRVDIDAVVKARFRGGAVSSMNFVGTLGTTSAWPYTATRGRWFSTCTSGRYGRCS